MAGNGEVKKKKKVGHRSVPSAAVEHTAAL
jgi:hypothetical protein